MKTYRQIKDQQPILVECFFAFSNQQFEEGKKKANIGDKKILDGGMGLYGTREGIQQLFDYYKNQDKEIAENCNPQDVYNYEYNNHECGYTNDDTEAIQIVVNIFGKERAKEVKRKHHYIDIEDI
jgi:hypothetical protein